jgi:hypothetical protein
LHAVRTCAVLFTATLFLGCHGNQILMPIAPAGGHYEWREPVDPARVGQAAAELAVPVDRPVGYAEARQRPLSAFGISARIQWNSLVGNLCGRFSRLCIEHNHARISVQEFEVRRAELGKATGALCALRAGFLQAVDDYDKAEALLAADMTPGERPPGVTPAVARALMEDARTRATQAIRAAAAAVERLDPERPPGWENAPPPDGESHDAG